MKLVRDTEVLFENSDPRVTFRSVILKNLDK